MLRGKPDGLLVVFLSLKCIFIGVVVPFKVDVLTSGALLERKIGATHLLHFSLMLPDSLCLQVESWVSVLCLSLSASLRFLFF